MVYLHIYSDIHSLFRRRLTEESETNFALELHSIIPKELLQKVRTCTHTQPEIDYNKH